MNINLDTMNEIEQLKNKPDTPVEKPQITIPILKIDSPNKKIPQFRFVMFFFK